MADKTVRVNVRGNAEKALAGISSKALAAAAAFAGLGAAAKQAVSDYAELDAAQGRLNRSFKQAGADAGAFAAAQKQMLDNMRQFGVGVLEQTNALRDLADTTGSVAEAQESLNLAIDIASQKNISVEQAAEKVRKVHQGEVEVLKELGVLTKDQAEQLGQVADQSERSSIALQFLSEKYEGAAEANAGLADQLNASKEGAKLMNAEVGNVVASLGDVGVGLIGGLLAAATGADSAASAFDKMRSSLSETASEVREAIPDIQALAAGFLSMDASEAAEFILAGGFANPEAVFGLVDKGQNARATPTGRPAPRPTGQPAPAAPGQSASARLAAAPRKGGAKSTPKRGGKRGGGGMEFGADEALDATGNPERALEIAQKKLEMDQTIDEGLRRQLDTEIKLLEIQQMRLDPQLEVVEMQRVEEAAIRDKEAAQHRFNAAIEDEKEARKKANKEAANKEAQKAEQERAKAMDASLSAVDRLSGAFIESEQAKAAISAAIEAARAWAAYPDVAGMVAHGTAATMFAVAAGQGGGGGGAAGAKGSFKTKGGTPIAANDGTEREAGGAVGRGMRDGGRQLAPRIVNVQFRSLSKPTNQEARELANAINDEMGTRV